MKNKKEIKIIFVDIDWTILNHQIGDWDYKSIKALQKAQKKGVLVFLCTARPYDSVYHTHLFDIFTPDGVISTNGAVAFYKDEIIHNNYYPKDKVEHVLKVLDQYQLTVELSNERERWLNRPATDYVHNYLKVYKEILPDVREWKDELITAILLFAPKKYDELIQKDLDPNISYFRFAEYGVDIQIFPERKGDGIKAVLKHLNIDKKYTMGIGDDYGDIDMFETCEVGVAMGNGKTEVKEKSDFVTKTISRHGVKYALKKYKVI